MGTPKFKRVVIVGYKPELKLFIADVDGVPDVIKEEKLIEFLKNFFSGRKEGEQKE